MGMIGKLLSFVRGERGEAKLTNVLIDPIGGANKTGEHFATPGDDSHPLASDYVLAISVMQTGRVAITGYLDPKNEGKAVAGEKRIYARDSEGAQVVDLWLKNTGEFIVENENMSITASPEGAVKVINKSGSHELKVSGEFHINGAVIDTSGNITSPGKIKAPNVEADTSLKAAGKEIAGHKHLHGTPETGPNI